MKKITILLISILILCGFSSSIFRPTCLPTIVKTTHIKYVAKTLHHGIKVNYSNTVDTTWVGCGGVIHFSIDTVIQGFMPIETYLLWGQSNATGQGDLNDLVPPYDDPLDSSLIFIPGTGFTVLEAGITNQGRPGNQVQTHGIELSFLDDMADARGNQVRLVKICTGSSNLWKSWHPNNIASWSTSYCSLFWLALVDANAARAAAYEEGIELDFKALIWYQGETEPSLHAAEYYANLSFLVDQTRIYLAEPDLNFIFVKILDLEANDALVRQAEDSLAATDPTRLKTVETNDLGPPVGLHLVSSDLIIVGHRTATVAQTF